MTIFYSYIEPLSRYSRVTLHLSPATIILNENPKYEMESLVATKKVTLKISQITKFGKTHSGYEPIRGGSRWKVQGVCTLPPPSPPSDDLRFSNTTGILPKKTMWFIGVEVEQETSASRPKKNPGSAPANVPVFQMFTELVEYCDATVLLSKT